jgi:hypothetical protein
MTKSSGMDRLFLFTWMEYGVFPQLLSHLTYFPLNSRSFVNIKI